MDHPSSTSTSTPTPSTPSQRHIPTKVLLKRKAVDEPVERLYIDDGPSSTGTGTPTSRYVFRRVANDAKRRALAQAQPSQQTPAFAATPRTRPPTVYATQPGQEDLVASGKIKPTATAAAGGPATTPRHFHFSKRALSALQRPSGRGARPSLAVFEEKREREKRRNGQGEGVGMGQDNMGGAEDMDLDMSDATATTTTTTTAGAAVATPKKPVVHATEREWRSANWSAGTPQRQQGQQQQQQKRTAEKPPVTGSGLNDDMMRKMEQLAEEVDNGPAAPAAAEEPAPTPNKFPCTRKFKPKVPARRLPERSQQQPNRDEQMMDLDGGEQEEEEEEEEDADYVYDTYERYIVSGPMATATADPDPTGPYGFLVIDAEDQELFWETFGPTADGDGAGGDSDREFDTDEDDENAEDWYGADYPEDEVATDDELDANAYAYRRRGGGASDEEEWAADRAVWSDEEDVDEDDEAVDALRFPWQKKRRDVPRYVTAEELSEEDAEGEEVVVLSD